MTILQSLKQKREQVNHKLIITGLLVRFQKMICCYKLNHLISTQIYTKIHTADGNGFLYNVNILPQRWVFSLTN
ncbi:hypothetical protein MKW98_023890, partial [Papaver atlanticum]